LTDEAFAAALFEQSLARSASAHELAAAVSFLAQQQELYRQSGLAGTAVRRSRESLAHVLLNHHDFVTIR
jgi:hypothetical protein